MPAPLTPEQLAEISVHLEKLTRKFEEDLLKDISRRIAKAGTVTDTAEWQLIQMSELGYAADYLEKSVAEYTEKSETEIEQLFSDAARNSDEFYSALYSAAGKSYTPLSENPYALQLISAGVEQTKSELRNFTRSMGFSIRQPDGSTTFKPAAEAYQNALDLAQFQVSAGVLDYNTAIRNATRTLTDSGLRFVDYASGHVNHADVAVRRAVLTGVSQLTGKIADDNAADLDTDIVEVSAHAGARPEHAVWQGRWYSLSGKSGKYPALVTATGYGSVTGLKGANCRHDYYPVIDGISVPTYTEEELANIDPPPIEYDGKTYTFYECTQRQRRIETAMRKTKRELVAAEASDDKYMFTAKSILLRRQREEYVKFSKAAGLLTQNERTQVYGFDRSKAAKAGWAGRKTVPSTVLTNGRNGGTINLENTFAGLKCNITHEQFVFSNGLEINTNPARSAIVYTTSENTRFIFPEKYDTNKQTMAPEQAIEIWSKVPPEIRSKAQKTIEFVDYYNPQDSYWRKVYKNFRGSYATGGDEITFWRYEKSHNPDYVLRTYCHEAGHYIDKNIMANGQRFSESSEWSDAMREDKKISKLKSITEYGKNSSCEDFAESIAEYVRDREAFTTLMPKRAEILKRILGM